MLEAAFGHTQDSVFVSWLPLFHDMGLVGQMLSAAYQGASAHLMAPATFVRAPQRWLQAVSTFRATMSGGPNFAYDLCVAEIDEAQKAGLDLSSWRSAFNGAEPIRATTLRCFFEAFKGCGLREAALYPCYGMAETTLIVSGSANDRLPVVRALDAEALERHAARDAGPDAPARDAVGSGRVVIESDVRIVDPETLAVCPADRVGEVWVRGAHVADGYWNKPEATAECFGARTAGGEGPFLRTGDLGFLDAEGELFIVGRRKDMVIVRGRNHAPQDLEWTVEQAHPAIRASFSAAFSVEQAGAEALVVIAEVERAQAAAVDRRALERAVRQAISREHEVALHAFLALPHGTLTKTSSGKIQRQAAKRRYLAGELQALAAPAAELTASVPQAAPVTP
jgi:acyl-CoA synthetase (AMP-forming)/AMP-acid ligase II